MGTYTKRMLRRAKPDRMQDKEPHTMPMKFDFDKPLFNLTNKPLKIPSVADDGKQIMKEANLGQICKWALLDVSEPNRAAHDSQGKHPNKILTGEEKFKRFQLAQKLHKGGIIQLEDKERALIRRLVGCGFNVEAVGIIWSILDNPIAAVPDAEVEAEAEDGDEAEAEAEDEDEAEADAETR